MADYNIDALRETDWDVTWDTTKAGLVDDVDPSGMKFMMKPKKSGTTGDVVLGDWFTGVTGTIKVFVREISTDKINALQPWKPAGHPPLNADMYGYAKLLTLHPHDLPASDRSQDLNFIKAVPITPYNVKRVGDKPDVWPVEFNIYCDRDRMLRPTPSYLVFYIGPTPPP